MTRLAAPHAMTNEMPTTDGAALPRPALTKIVATVGPASSDEATLARLIEAGVAVFRLNFSHGTLDGHAEVLETIRRVAWDCRRPIAVLGDLPGPKIRVGSVAGDGIDLEPGDVVILQRDERTAPAGESPCRLSCTRPSIIGDVHPGERLLVADGRIRMLVVETGTDEIECSVTTGGRIRTGAGINLPDTDLAADALTPRDLECVAWAVEHDIDFLGLSFVERALEVHRLRERINEHRARYDGNGRRIQIVAKFERPAAVRDMEAIVDASDAIMVARGDLGVEMEVAQVPVIQKNLLQLAQDYGKPAIVATQMLESMIDAPAPTRAEASDVANAIFDHADAVMLSGETAMGRFPVITVETMRGIASAAEAHVANLPARSTPPVKLVESRYWTAALAHGVWTIVRDMGAKFIVVWSQEGGGARLLSQNNFTIPIVAISTDEQALRHMQLLRSVVPVRMGLPESQAHFTRMVDAYLLETSWAQSGDGCVIVAGARFGEARTTNALALHRVGDATTGFRTPGD